METVNDPSEPVLPRVTSPRVVLRDFQASDIEVISEAATDPYIQSFAGLDPQEPDSAAGYIARQRARVARGLGYSFAVEDALSTRLVGQIGLWLRAVAPDGTTGYREEAHGRATVGYWTAPSSRGNGYSTAALKALTDWALSLGTVERLEAFIEPWNEPSWRAAQSAGYVREGLLRSWQRIGADRRDMYAYSRLPSDPPPD